MSKKYPDPKDHVPKPVDNPKFKDIRGRTFIDGIPTPDAVSISTILTRMEPKTRYDMRKFRRVHGIFSVMFHEVIPGQGPEPLLCRIDIGQFGVYVPRDHKRIAKYSDLPDYSKADLDQMTLSELDMAVEHVFKDLEPRVEYLAYRFFDDDYHIICNPIDFYRMSTNGVTMAS